MQKIYKYVVVALLLVLAAALYEIAHLHLFKDSTRAWRTESWKQVDISLADLQPSSPDVPRTDYGEKVQEVFTKQPGVESGTGYTISDPVLASMEEDIRVSAPSISEAELAFKRAIYLKKFASVAFSKPSPERERMIAEAYDQLYYNIFRLPAIAVNEEVNLRYIRRLYTHVLDFTYQGAKDPSLFFASKFNEGKYFKELVQKYGSENKEVVSVLYIDSLYSEQDLVNDQLVLANKLLALAQLFQDQYVIDHEELRTDLYLRSIKLVELYPTAKKSVIHSSDVDNIVLPKAAYANALGILARLHRSRITVEQAHQAFEDARKTLIDKIRSKDDILYWTLVRLEVGEVEFLYRTNGNKVNDEIKALLKNIAAQRAEMSQNKESAEWYDRFFKGVIADRDDSGKKTRPFIDAAKSEPSMQAILDELSQ